MAQTRTKKASGSKPRSAATKAATTRSATKAKRASPKASPKRKAASKTSTAKRSPASGNGAGSGKASSNGHSRLATTLPLVAGGAALAGTVGGVLIGASRSGDKVLGVRLPHPKRVRVKLRSSDLAKAAKEVGRFGENIGELTTELKRTRQGLAGDNRHSSPIEVLLRGLTARR